MFHIAGLSMPFHICIHDVFLIKSLVLPAHGVIIL